MSTAVNIGLVVLAAIVLKYWIFPDTSKPPQLAEKFNSSYDYIVVGSGSAGSVVASRLSEDKDVSVLLIEAGDYVGDNPFISVPALAPFALGSEVDWTYRSEPKEGIMAGFKDERSFWPQGKVLGGSSSINAMLYVRASRHDYDRWAKYTKDERWDYRHVLPYFKKSESIKVQGLKNSPYHGNNGPFTIKNVDSNALSNKILEAGQAAGFPFNEDYNGKTMEGIGRSQVNINDGERMSVGRAFINGALERPNLDLVVKAHVQKVIIKNKKALGVEVIKNGKKHIVNANKEIILSAGAIGTPQILMLSGIGPKKHLESLKIPLVVDLPVGQNLQDHLMFDIGVKVRDSFYPTLQQTFNLWSKLQFKFFGSGPLISPYAGLETLAFKSTTKETREKDWPDLQLLLATFVANDAIMDAWGYSEETKAQMANRNEVINGFCCMPSLIRPESVGNISLRSSDPFDYPAIYPNYLDKQEDIELLIRGIQECKKIVNSKPMQEIGAELTEKGAVPACGRNRYDSHEYWECMVKLRPLTIYHPIGTAKMGPKGDPTAVVDPELRVQGISGLRVADASIMPWIVSGNTNAATIMIGEVVSDFIRGKKLEPIDL